MIFLKAANYIFQIIFSTCFRPLGLFSISVQIEHRLVDTVCPDRGVYVNHNTDGLGAYKTDTPRRRWYLRDLTVAAAMT